MQKAPTSFLGHFFPIGVFLLLLVYGLFVHPVVIGGERLPVEVLVLIALCVNSFYLLYRGYAWSTIESSITRKVGESIPVVMILLSVGAYDKVDTPSALNIKIPDGVHGKRFSIIVPASSIDLLLSLIHI